MATTTAQIKLTSSDLSSDAIAIDVTTTLKNSDGTTGITDTSGFAVKKFTGTGAVTVHDAADFEDNKSTKFFVHNKATDSSHYITITLGAVVLGRVYAGDWVLVPYAGLVDIKLTASTAGIICEHAVLGNA